MIERSSLYTGWSPVLRSMIDSRRIPSAAVSSNQIPSESGPRWTMASHIEWRTACRSSDCPWSRSTQPVMPHILESDPFPHGIDRLVLRFVIGANQQFGEQSHEEK